MSEDIVSHKRCPQCGETKLFTSDFFNRDKNRKSGLYPLCKLCHKKGGTKQVAVGEKRCCTKCGNEYPLTHEYFSKDRCSATGLRTRCKECERVSADEYRKKNPEKAKQAWARHYAKNPERRREGTRLSRKKHHARRLAYEKEYRQLNADKISIRARIYQKEHPEIFAILASKRRATQRGLVAAFTQRDWQQCLKYFDYRCVICGRPVGLWHTIAREHWIAINDPRPDNPGTVPWNIVPMCHAVKGSSGQGACNNSKGDKDPVEWLTSAFSRWKATEILRRIEAYFAQVKRHD